MDCYGAIHFRPDFRTPGLHHGFRSHGVPVPANGTCCGLPPPLSLIETLAVREPVVDGVNVTPIKQLAPPGKLVPQLLTSAKSPAFVPVIVIPEMLTVTLPLLLTVTFFCRLVVPTG